MLVLWYKGASANGATGATSVNDNSDGSEEIQERIYKIICSWIINKNNYLIYISRSPIPGFKSKEENLLGLKRQVCIYGYPKNKLLKFKKNKKFPNDSILGEETGFTKGTNDITWVIDPIDGTRAFSQHKPEWGVLVSRIVKNEISTGIVICPVQDIYTAVHNNKLITSSFDYEQIEIADKEDYKMPATIDDPAILDEIKESLIENKILN